MLQRLQHPEDSIKERAVVSLANLSDNVSFSVLKEIIDENILM